MKMRELLPLKEITFILRGSHMSMKVFSVVYREATDHTERKLIQTSSDIKDPWCRCEICD